MKLLMALLIASLLQACTGFSEPSWLSDARAEEEAKRPLCPKLNGVLQNLDKRGKAMKTQEEYNKFLASQRSQVTAAYARCKARNKTYSN